MRLYIDLLVWALGIGGAGLAGHGHPFLGIGLFIACLGYFVLVFNIDWRGSRAQVPEKWAEPISAINGLPLPSHLLDLIKAGRWRHPGDPVLRAVIPFLEGPVDFLSIESMRLAASWSPADVPRWSAGLHEYRGSRSAAQLGLPWLDADKAVWIAENRVHGDDLGIALDYRTHPSDPRVVATEWLPGQGGRIYREVAPTFEEFARRLGLGTVA